MLKRIAVVGRNDKFDKQMEKAAQGEDIEVVHLTPNDSLPPATTALAFSEAEASVAVGLILQLAAQHEQLLDLLSFAIDSREQHPGAGQRAKEHASRFAKALAISNADRSVLERAALVHGIGKLKIPNDVLLKKSVLTYDEWMLLQTHTNLGAEIVRGIDFLGDTEEIIRRHHCCYDGTGYPDGLEGDEIPYLARALKLLDVYCAMTSPRHYRTSYSSHDEAIAYLKSESGKHFDPELVKVFVKAEVGQPLPENGPIVPAT